MWHMDAERRQQLEREWLTLTQSALPAAARRNGWPIREGPCFQRVILDNACRGPWAPRSQDAPAHREASDAVLMSAVTLARATLKGRADIARLYRQSLRWRARQD